MLTVVTNDSPLPLPEMPLDRHGHRYEPPRKLPRELRAVTACWKDTAKIGRIDAGDDGAEVDGSNVTELTPTTPALALVAVMETTRRPACRSNRPVP